jgi:hypothetical protein
MSQPFIPRIGAVFSADIAAQDSVGAYFALMPG